LCVEFVALSYFCQSIFPCRLYSGCLYFMRLRGLIVVLFDAHPPGKQPAPVTKNFPNSPFSNCDSHHAPYRSMICFSPASTRVVYSLFSINPPIARATVKGDPRLLQVRTRSSSEVYRHHQLSLPRECAKTGSTCVWAKLVTTEPWRRR